jgi:hypothetical protein
MDRRDPHYKKKQQAHSKAENRVKLGISNTGLSQALLMVAS